MSTFSRGHLHPHTPLRHRCPADHYFCDSCWRNHFTSAVATMGNACVESTMCPEAPSCHVHADELAWSQLADEVRPWLS